MYLSIYEEADIYKVSEMKYLIKDLGDENPNRLVHRPFNKYHINQI